MNKETLAYNPGDWKEDATALKPYGWGIVDTNGDITKDI